MKNLKEINEDFLQKKGYELFLPVHFRILRKEAIKEIKEFEKRPKGTTKFAIPIPQGNSYFSILLTKEVIDYIKWKNNISEEDLK